MLWSLFLLTVLVREATDSLVSHGTVALYVSNMEKIHLQLLYVIIFLDMSSSYQYNQTINLQSVFTVTATPTPYWI